MGRPRWLNGLKKKNNLPAKAGDSSSIPGPGRSPGEGRGNPLQCSHLENPTDRGAWRAAVQSQTRVSRPACSLAGYSHRVAKSWTRLREQTATA